MYLKRALVLVSVLFAVGCGGSSNSSNNNSAPGPLSGNWQFSLPQSNANLLPRTQSGFLLQQKDAITGSMVVKVSGCSGVGDVTGSISGSNVALVTNLTGVSVNLTGTIGSDQASMNGNYTLLVSGCNGLNPATGTFTANLVKPLTGNFTGSFTSTNANVPTVAISGKLAQQNSVALTTSAPLSGNMTATGYCFSSANFTGYISGTDVALNFLASDGTQLGQITGTASLDGTQVSGLYKVLPQGAGAKFPCGGGDGGSAVLILGSQ